MLKKYLIKGYAVKDTIKLEQYEDLKQTIKLLSNVMDRRQLHHSFSDGNKRIVHFCSFGFMEKKGILYNIDGTKRIGDNALVALTLMIAESRTEEKT